MSIEQISAPPQSAPPPSPTATATPSSVEVDAPVADAPAPLPLSPVVYETFALFLLFFSLVMLAWSGTFHSDNELSMYAVSDSFVRYGSWDAEQVRWMGTQESDFGRNGLFYSREGLATSLMALPLLWLGLKLPGRQTFGAGSCRRLRLQS